MKLKYPDSLEDHPAIIDYAAAVEDASSSYRGEIDYNAVGNVLYYLGYQNQTYMPQYSRWRPLAYNLPVVNRFAPLVNTVVSTLVRFNVPITYTAQTDEPADVASALVADKIQAIIERETESRLWTPEEAYWTVLTGNAFKISGYEHSENYGTRFEQHQQCVGNALAPGCGAVVPPQQVAESQGRCPNCGGQGLMPAERMGQAIGGQIPRGRHTTEIKSALSCFFNNQSSRIEHSPYFMVEDRVPRAWIETVYGEDVVDTLSTETSSVRGTSLADSLAYAVGTTGLGATDGQEADDVYRMRRVWIDPHPTKAPGGIYAVLIGETVMEAIAYPFRNEYGRPMRPIVHTQFDQVPGRLLGKSRCDDLRPLQDQLNKIEAYLDLHTKRMAGGKLITPRGIGLGRVTGETGQVLTYDAMPGVPPPQFIPGMSVPQYFFQWKQDVLAAMDAVMGTFEVSRGEAPKGVSAYAAIQYLDEQATQAQSNIQGNWAISKMAWAKQQLCIWKEYADEQRTMSLGFGAWSVQKFSKADFTGVDVDVDVGQNRPRSGVAKRAIIDQLVRLGGINMMDPAEKDPVIRALGADELLPDRKVDEDRAARENDAFLGPPNPALPVPPPDLMQLAGYPMPFPWESPMVHLRTHKTLLLSEKGDSLPPPNRAALVAHMMIHQRQVDEAMMRGSLGPGQIAPAGPGNEMGANGGTAKGGDRSGTDQGQLDQETQGASPDSFSGASR